MLATALQQKLSVGIRSSRLDVQSRPEWKTRSMRSLGNQSVGLARPGAVPLRKPRGVARRIACGCRSSHTRALGRF